jgi:hypothetical protein
LSVASQQRALVLVLDRSSLPLKSDFPSWGHGGMPVAPRTPAGWMR